MNTKTLFGGIVTSTALAFGVPAITAPSANDGNMNNALHDMESNSKSMPFWGT